LAGDRVSAMGSYNEPRLGSGRVVRRPPEHERFMACGQTDVGCERESNEDCFLICTQKRHSGYFVFDGMGGQPAGEAAALISADTVRESLQCARQGDPANTILEAIETAQRVILARTVDKKLKGMGTTAVGVVISGNELALGAVGDSRAYHIKIGSVAQITSDHTLVQQLVDAGKITQSDAMVHPQSHILTRCLGSELGFAVDTKSFLIECEGNLEAPIEWILLCSDGLYGLVSDEEMAAVVTSTSAAEAASQLIDIARSRGGFDNITALIVPIRGKLIERTQGSERTRGQRWSNESDGSLEQESSFVVANSPILRSARGIRNHFWRILAIAALSAAATMVCYAIFNMRWG